MYSYRVTSRWTTVQLGTQDDSFVPNFSCRMECSAAICLEGMQVTTESAPLFLAQRAAGLAAESSLSRTPGRQGV